MVREVDRISQKDIWAGYAPGASTWGCAFGGGNKAGKAASHQYVTEVTVTFEGNERWAREKKFSGAVRVENGEIAVEDLDGFQIVGMKGQIENSSVRGRTRRGSEGISSGDGQYTLEGSLENRFRIEAATEKLKHEKSLVMEVFIILA